MRYRGYPIEQLATHSTHLESAYLLIYGSLPSKDQYKIWEREVMHHSVVHSDAEDFFRSFRCVAMCPTPTSPSPLPVLWPMSSKPKY